MAIVNAQIEKALTEQVELLRERAKDPGISVTELVLITHALDRMASWLACESNSESV